MKNYIFKLSHKILKLLLFLTRTTITTTKPYLTKWARLHGSNNAIMFYLKPNLDPTY